jgi:hypothetical protein
MLRETNGLTNNKICAGMEIFKLNRTTKHTVTGAAP